MNVKLVSITQSVIAEQDLSAEELIVYTARVSNPSNQLNMETADKLLAYLVKNRHWCYDEETEVFTTSGWKLFKDVTSFDCIAAIDPKDCFSIKFEKPTAFLEQFYVGGMIEGRSTSLNYKVTPNHRMLYQKLGKDKKDWQISEAKDIIGQWKRFRKTAKFKEYENNELEYYNGLLFGFCLGDGFQTSANRVGIRLKRERKINFLESVLGKLDYNFSKKQCKNGAVQYIIHDLPFSLPKGVDKKINLNFSVFCPDYYKGLFQGLMESDGSVKRQGWVYSTNSPVLKDEVIALATYCGYCVDNIRKRHISNPNHNVNYIFTIKSRDNAQLRFDSSNTSEKIVSYSGNIYCCEVSTGMLLVRREGKQMVCGNSPFEMVDMTVDITTSRGIAQQILRHRSFSFQEFSQRYAEATDFEPIQLRKSGATNRQSSLEVFDPELGWETKASEIIQVHLNNCDKLYQQLLTAGVAKECARFVLPITTQTRIFMKGSIRSWIHYLQIRMDEHTQLEHREIAFAIRDIFALNFPNISKGLGL